MSDGPFAQSLSYLFGFYCMHSIQCTHCAMQKCTISHCLMEHYDLIIAHCSSHAVYYTEMWHNTCYTERQRTQDLLTLSTAHFIIHIAKYKSNTQLYKLHTKHLTHFTKSKHYILKTTHFTKQTMHYTPHLNRHCTLHTTHCTLNARHCTLHTTPWTLNARHCTLNTTRCTLNARHYTLHTKLSRGPSLQ